MVIWRCFTNADDSATLGSDMSAVPGLQRAERQCVSSAFPAVRPAVHVSSRWSPKYNRDREEDHKSDFFNFFYYESAGGQGFLVEKIEKVRILKENEGVIDFS